MADGTKIEWTDATWNPIIGCTRVSPGCDHCYAITNARIRESNPHPAVAAAYDGVVEQTDHGVDWTGKVNLLADRLDQPLRWTRPRRIFVNAQSDLFHEAVPDEFIASVFAVMAAAGRHTFQVLTKRHARMRALLASPAFADLLDAALRDLMMTGRITESTCAVAPGLPLPNVWLGVSMEDQRWADIRIPALLDTPAAVRFLSCEPLLGPVDLRLPPPRPWTPLEWVGEYSRVDWVIAGGESGPGARPMNPRWVRTLRDDCAEAGVPFLMKQWGDWRPGGSHEPGTHRAIYEGTDAPVPVADDTRIRSMWTFGGGIVTRVGKKAAGRTLDGVVHDGYPATQEVPV